MIYLDSSILLARVLVEARSPPDAFWSNELVSSRLLEYELMNRIHVRAVGPERIDDARHLLDRVSLLGLSADVLARALAPFPVAVRTLDGLHLATMDFLRRRGQTVQLASYDRRLTAAATALAIPLFPV